MSPQFSGEKIVLGKSDIPLLPHRPLDATDLYLHFVSQVKQNSTPAAARIEVNSITARALAKAMWTNTSLTRLDLSGNSIDDPGGASIARLLKRNSALVNVALGSNQLGVFACRAFGESLRTNSTLKSLDLESNSLTHDGSDTSGIRALADMFSQNESLTSVNLWRCSIGRDAGAVLSRGLESNRTITFLEVGHNGVTMIDQHKIKGALDSNLKRFEESQAVRLQDQSIANSILVKERALQDQLRAERQLREWLEDQKKLRAEERRKFEEKR